MNKTSVTPFHRLTAWVTLLAFIFTSLPAHATLSEAGGRIIFNRDNDLRVPLAGIPITVTRTYDSRDKCPDDFDGEITWVTQPEDPFAPLFSGATGWVFTAQDGRKFEFSAAGKLTRMSDRNGNTLTFSDAGIFHSSGAAVTFARDAQGRISDITDPAGKVVHYGYSSPQSSGDLTSVTNRVGDTTTMTYSGPHNLGDILDPRGVRTRTWRRPR